VSRRLAVLGAAFAIVGSAVGVAVVARGAFTGTATGSPSTPAAPVASADVPVTTSTSGTAPTAGTPSLSQNAPIRAGGQPASAPPKLLGPLEADTPITFDLALKMTASDASIEQYLDSLYDPTSPNYRRFLTAAQFGAKFGLPLQRIEGVQTWATTEGFDVLGSVDQRTAIRLSSTAGLVTDVFGVHLGRYLDPASGDEFHAPLDQEQVPSAISDAVVGLSGLDTRPDRSSAELSASRPSADVPADGLGPVDLAKAYDITPMYQAGYLGDGQTIAIVSFDTFKASDIATYDKQFGIDGPAVKRVAVGTPLKAPGDGAVEVSLDIEVVRAIAPHAQILNFEAKNGDVDHADLIDAIVQDGRADIVTDSWGKCDVADHFAEGSRAHGLRALQAAAAAGITFFIASGDHGAFDCWANDPSDHREVVDFPSASPYSVSVGGTQLSVRTDGTYLTESGWEDFLSTGGSGGGNNPTEKRPTWQVGPGVDNQFSNGKRQSPDVSAAAAVDSAYAIYYTQSDGTAGWSHVYGTSAASPFWAASMLLIRQLAQQEGVGKLGFVDPMLYALANTDQRASIFHDVTTGGNLQHPAGPGWDYATGLGSPDVTGLADAIVQYLAANPAG
jgi:kumamolisin